MRERGREGGREGGRGREGERESQLPGSELSSQTPLLSVLFPPLLLPLGHTWERERGGGKVGK